MIRALLFGLLLSTWASPVAVRAETTPQQPVVCEQVPRCSEQVQSALQQAKTNREAALAAMQDAYNQYPDPRLCYNLGRLLQQLQRPTKAAEQYRQFLESGVESRPEMLIKARTYLEQVERESEALRKASQPPTAVVPPVSIDPAPSTTTLAAGALVAGTQPETKKVYKKWWFWTLVGGASAVIAVGTTLGVLSREPDLSGVTQYRPFAQ